MAWNMSKQPLFEIAVVYKNNILKCSYVWTMLFFQYFLDPQCIATQN